MLHPHPLFPSRALKLDRSKRPAAKPLAVFFEQRHCAQCDELHAGPLKDTEILQLLEKFEIARVDMRAARSMVAPNGKAMTEAQFARTLDVAFAPSIVFFDERGLEVFRTEAYLRTFHIRAAFDYVSSGSYRTQPSFQRFLQARADALREKGEVPQVWK